MIGKIIIIESLPARERKTGKELHDDVVTKYTRFYDSAIQTEYYEVNSKSEFLELLEDITQNISDKTETILHIEAHGRNEEMQFSNYELFKWVQLEKKLLVANAKSKNNLHLVLATCYGMHVAENISLIGTAPYKSFISALKELNISEIIGDYTILYEEIIRTKDIFRGFINFLERQQQTQLRIKDLKTVLYNLLSMQILRFIHLDSSFDLKIFYDVHLNIKIDRTHLQDIESPSEKVNYITDVFFKRYFLSNENM